MATTSSILTPTARLEFARWLVQSGRLSDYPATAGDVAQAQQAHTGALETVLPTPAVCLCVHRWHCRREYCPCQPKCIHGICKSCFCGKCEA